MKRFFYNIPQVDLSDIKSYEGKMVIIGKRLFIVREGKPIELLSNNRTDELLSQNVAELDSVLEDVTKEEIK